ncbi:MAG: FtsK/SpoIIIE domain-containing protein, partial [Thermincolia bacterium]
MEDNPFVEVAASIRSLWRHRPGQEIPGTILDTFDNLGFITKDGRKPVIVGKKKTAYGWHLVFNLPPGISFAQVKRRQDYFADATKSWVVLSWNGHLHMDIQCNTLPTSVEYTWSPCLYPKMALPVPVGVSQKGPEVFDLASAPHLLVAGIPGFGKSNFLHVLIHSMMPSARICVIDLKRLEFSYLRDYVLLAKSEDDATTMLHALNREHDRRIEKLERAGVVKVQDYSGDDMPYIVVVIDEVAELRGEITHELINRLLRLARATGISIVSATQRPSVKVIDGDSRAQYSARLCYLVADEVNSRMVLGEECPLAAHLPADHKGRAIFKFG